MNRKRKTNQSIGCEQNVLPANLSAGNPLAAYKQFVKILRSLHTIHYLKISEKNVML